MKRCIAVVGLLVAFSTNFGSVGSAGEAVPQWKKDAAKELNEEGVNLYSGRKYEEAIKKYSEALSVDSTDLLTYSNRAMAYAQLKQYDRAMADFDSSIKILPTQLVYNNRGRVKLVMKDYDGAIADYERSIEIDVKAAEPYYYAGKAYYLKNDFARAEVRFGQAIQIKPEEAPFHYARGMSRVKQGKYDKGITDLKKALEIDPTYETAKQELAAAIEEAKKQKKAPAVN